MLQFKDSRIESNVMAPIILGVVYITKTNHQRIQNYKLLNKTESTSKKFVTKLHKHVLILRSIINK